GTDPVVPLGSGQSSPESELVGAPTTPGTYWIGACVDAVSGEASTSNNCSAGVQVTVSPQEVVPVWVNEVHAGTPDYIELYNSGSQAAQLSGWQLVSSGGATDTHPLPSFVLAPGQYLKVVEGGGTDTADTIFTGNNFNWVSGGDGSVALIDDGATGVDFVRWGTSTFQPPSGTTWTGPNVATPASDSEVIGRYSGIDTDSPADWCSQLPSAPGPNFACGDLLFADGFETGNVSAWDGVLP
ncbi:MAG: lamin tail domain-containing protein, partial [Holophagales bacterium]|nr:lamin tail domain-containing protein [Holophagales bacterium]